MVGSHPIVETWQTDADGNEYWEYTPYNYWEDDAYDPNDPDSEFEWRDVIEGFPEYDVSDDLADATWYQVIYYWRYVINCIVFGLP